MIHVIIVSVLLGMAAALCMLCGLGLAVVRDPFQRLHFASPVTSIAIALITAAVWMDDAEWESRIKSLLIAALLFTMNGVLSHATARAVRIRRVGQWPIKPEERLPVVKNKPEGGIAVEERTS